MGFLGQRGHVRSFKRNRKRHIIPGRTQNEARGESLLGGAIRGIRESADVVGAGRADVGHIEMHLEGQAEEIPAVGKLLIVFVNIAQQPKFK